MPTELKTLITGYAQETATLVKLEKAAELTKNKRSAYVKQIFDLAGKGPHELGDGRGPCMIVVKGSTHFFTPVNKKKAPIEIPAITE